MSDKIEEKDAVEQNIRKKAKSISTLIADYLTEKIENGDMLPGERLIQMELAERFKVSRIAVRDSLQKLKQRGLIVDSETHGVIIRPLSIETVEEIFIVRSLIESHLIGEVGKVLHTEDFEYLHHLADDMQKIDLLKDVNRYMEMDREFHFYIFKKSNKKYMIEILNLIWLRFRQARSMVKKDPQWIKGWLDQAHDKHLQLLAALKQKRHKSAAAMMRSIIIDSGRRLVEELKARGWAIEDR